MCPRHHNSKFLFAVKIFWVSSTRYVNYALISEQKNVSCYCQTIKRCKQWHHDLMWRVKCNCFFFSNIEGFCILVYMVPGQGCLWQALGILRGRDFTSCVYRKFCCIKYSYSGYCSYSSFIETKFCVRLPAVLQSELFLESHKFCARWVIVFHSLIRKQLRSFEVKRSTKGRLLK